MEERQLWLGFLVFQKGKGATDLNREREEDGQGLKRERLVGRDNRERERSLWVF